MIRKLLTVDKKKRYTCADALKHEWFTQMETKRSQSQIDPNVIKSLSEFKGVSYLKKEAMNILVKTLREKEILHLKTQFEQIDTDQTGMISASELKEAMKKSQKNYSDDQIEEMFKNIEAHLDALESLKLLQSQVPSWKF